MKKDTANTKKSKLALWQKEDAKRLRALWESRCRGTVTQTEFAERWGFRSQGNLSHYLAGRQPLNVKAVRAFASGMGVSVSEISPRLAAEIQRLADEEYVPPIALGREEGVRVIGTAQLLDDGYWLELQHNAGVGDGRIMINAKDRGAYAIRVLGESMAPRIHSGEFVLVEPDHAVQPGDTVVIVTSAGRRMVKQFLFARDGYVTLNNIQNNEHVSLPEKEIDSMHYVSGILAASFFSPD